MAPIAPPPTAVAQPVAPRPAEGDAAVSLHGVTRRFGTETALDSLDVVAPTGRITVLLGPNGAGKTTTIRMITGALPPDEGTVRTLGLDPGAHGHEVRLRCGVVSAKPALYDRLSGMDNLLYAGRLYRVGGDLESRIRAAAARFGIEHALDQQVGGYSTGMKTRLALARSVLHEPELLLYDEPTSGLDPESSQAVLQMIREMTSDGRTVVLCTHHLVEAEGLADHVVVMDRGTDVVSGAPGELARRFWPENVVRIGVSEPAGLAALCALAGSHGVISVAPEPGALGAAVQIDDMSRVPAMVAELVASGVGLTRVVPWEPSLEDLYFRVRGASR